MISFAGIPSGIIDAELVRQIALLSQDTPLSKYIPGYLMRAGAPAFWAAGAVGYLLIGWRTPFTPFVSGPQIYTVAATMVGVATIGLPYERFFQEKVFNPVLNTVVPTGFAVPYEFFDYTMALLGGSLVGMML